MKSASIVSLALVLSAIGCQKKSTPNPGPLTTQMNITGGVIATGGVDATAAITMPMIDSGVPMTTGMDAAMAAIPPGPCNQASTAPGCTDTAIEQCVCAGPGGDVCCSQAWDAICVALVQSLGCKGDCCNATGAMGCTNSTVESTVCAQSPYCCDTGVGWDDFCTIVAAASGSNCM